MGSQSLRRSQFIITYGPGAILEGSQGPRIIPTLERSRVFDGRNPADYEITDLRLSEALLSGAAIVRLPSNAEVGVPDTQDIYETERFPAWSLCVQHGILYHKTTTTPANQACPRCRDFDNRFDAWRQAGRQAIRFVRACTNGHLDDVDWVGIIDHTRDNCHPNYLIWHGGGGALRHVSVQCPICRALINLGVAYAREWTCSGRYPEQGRDRPGGCSVMAKIIQRGAANLRISELQTALTIPPRATQLHRLLEMDRVRTVLAALPHHSKAALVAALQRLVQQRLIGQGVVDEIQRYDEAVILEAIGDVLAGGLPQGIRDLRLQEFEALRHAAVNGAPPQPSSTPGAPPQFEVIRNHVRSVPGRNGRSLRVTPVDRLRVVMVQTGYRRLDPVNSVPVDRCFFYGEREWYPGVELFGEGLFVDLETAHHYPLNGAANAWLDEWHRQHTFRPGFTGEERDHLHPIFVWWHTLSHRLINALAVDSGYSSAAVRERVYVNVDPSTGTATGGVLLYTAQPGGDGTLGGLIALVPEFERVLDSAFRTLDACSNDPLCGEEAFASGKYNGAACYACALVSETSCEYRNMRLDRNLLRDNLP